MEEAEEEGRGFNNTMPMQVVILNDMLKTEGSEGGREVMKSGSFPSHFPSSLLSVTPFILLVLFLFGKLANSA